MDAVPPLPISRSTRIVRVLGAISLCASASVLAIVLCASAWILRYDPEKGPVKALLISIGVIPALGIAALVLLVARNIAAKWTLPCAVVCIAFLLYLGTDDSARIPPPAFEPLASATSAEFHAYMHMSKGTETDITSNVIRPAASERLFISTDLKDWEDFLTQNRARILDEWASNQEGQRWLERMAMLPADVGAIVHLTPESPIIAFQPVRILISQRLAFALLLSREGDNEEAAGHLTTILRACVSLQRIGVGLVDEMVGSVFLKMTYKGISFLLDHGEVEPETRAKLITALKESPPISMVIQRTVIGDTQCLRAIFDRIAAGTLPDAPMPQSGMAKRLFELITPAAYHPKRTEREIRMHYERINEFAKARQLDALKAETASFTTKCESLSSLRNPVGRRLAGLSIPALHVVVEKLWEQDDARLALLARLHQPVSDASVTPERQ